MAAAAWSWVEKMLHEAQRTSAPRAVSVSMRTAVWIVMWSGPVTRAPLSGCRAPYSSRSAMRPGISCSASVIALRPYSASERSATLKSCSVLVGVVAAMGASPRSGGGQELLVLALLPVHPVVGGHVLGTLGLGLEPRLHRIPEIPVAAHA